MPQLPTGLMSGLGQAFGRQANILEDRRREEDNYNKQREFLAYQLAQQEEARRRSMGEGGSEFMRYGLENTRDQNRLANIRADLIERTKEGGVSDATAAAQLRGERSMSEGRWTGEDAFMPGEAMAKTKAQVAGEDYAQPFKLKWQEQLMQLQNKHRRGRGSGSGSGGYDPMGFNKSFPSQRIDEAYETENLYRTGVGELGHRWKSIMATGIDPLDPTSAGKTAIPQTPLNKLSNTATVESQLIEELNAIYGNPDLDYRYGVKDDLANKLVQQAINSGASLNSNSPAQTAAPKTPLTIKAKVKLPPISTVTGKN